MTENDRDLNDRNYSVDRKDRSPRIEVSGRFFHVLYPMQLVTPSVVAIAVRMLMAICRIVFQVFAFIFLNVECC